MTLTTGKIKKDIEVCSLHPQRKKMFCSNESRQDVHTGGCIICITPINEE